MTRQEFLAWEQASIDSIDVKRCYIDMAGGDLVAGVLLSQIIYWHLPSRQGHERLRIEKEGELWLAKGRADWWEECRISPKQFDRAAALLEEKDLIETDVRRFKGNPTKHIRVCWDNFLRDLVLITLRPAGGKNDIPQRSITESPKGEERSSPKGDNHIAQTSISLTESPTENTQRTLQRPAAPAAPEIFAPLSPEEVPEKKEPGPPPRPAFATLSEEQKRPWRERSEREQRARAKWDGRPWPADKPLSRKLIDAGAEKLHREAPA